MSLENKTREELLDEIQRLRRLERECQEESKAIQKSEELCRAQFQSQDSIKLILNQATGNVIDVNQAACEFFGYSRNELLLKRIPDIINLPHGRIAEYRSANRGRIDATCQIQHNLKSGELRDLELFITPFRVNGEELLSCVVHDVTERKKAENALRFSEARYRALFHDNPIMIFTLDAAGLILSANPVCALQLGYTTDELEGRPGLEVFFEDDRPAVAEQLRECLKNPNRAYRWQFRKVSKDGELVWVEETAQAVYDLNGEKNILVVCHDISERKQAEEEIGRLNSDLMARAAELEAANQELEAFNYSVAHDLRQPLNVICIYSQAIREQCGDKLDQECRDYLQESYDCALRMDRLIGALLSFSRMGHVEPSRGVVDLSVLANDVVKSLKQVEPERMADFRIGEGITANADANLLRIVLDNLVGNAWKFTGMRENAVIEFGMSEIDGRTVYFVRDNGAGFVREDADRLFVPFQRLPNAGKFRGFGIGLATVERIIRRHGGRIWAEGEPDKGATFFFTLSADGG